MDIGLRIKEKRKASVLTQSQLAELSGVAVITIRQYESNKRKPRADQLRSIASALGVTVDYLLDVKPAHAVDPNETEAEREKRLGLPEGYFKRLRTPEDFVENEKQLNQQLKGIDFALYGEVKDLTDEQKMDVIDYIQFKKSKEK